MTGTAFGTFGRPAPLRERKFRWRADPRSRAENRSSRPAFVRASSEGQTRRYRFLRLNRQFQLPARLRSQPLIRPFQKIGIEYSLVRGQSSNELLQLCLLFVGLLLPIVRLQGKGDLLGRLKSEQLRSSRQRLQDSAAGAHYQIGIFFGRGRRDDAPELRFQPIEYLQLFFANHARQFVRNPVQRPQVFLVHCLFANADHLTYLLEGDPAPPQFQDLRFTRRRGRSRRSRRRQDKASAERSRLR